MSPEVQGRVWDPAAADQGLERWWAICAEPETSCSPARVQGLALVFGASWHFSRYAFSRQAAVLACIPETADDAEQRFARLLQAIVALGDDRMLAREDPEKSLKMLRVCKNAAMCCALVGYLWGWWELSRLEHGLTRIADHVLQIMIQRFALEEIADDEVLVLGMGRLAGFEMDFGSDLDLIFLGRSADRHFAGLVKRVRGLLQAMGRYDPDGVLYAIDTRLRPHGRSGTLISSYEQFLAFHRGDREIWERQMMTRNRQLHTHAGLREWFEEALHAVLYSPRPVAVLRREIAAMRRRVEDAAGRVAGQYDLKRGAGGLMDIDFITHYFQLLHGHERAALRIASTRGVLWQLAAASLMPAEQAASLRVAYDFLKRVESVLRVYDMKNISCFRSTEARLPVLARAMGYVRQDGTGDAQEFLGEYQRVTARVRQIFTQVLAA